MRRWLSILFFSICVTGKAFAGACDSENWSWTVYKKEKYAKFTFKNKSDYVAKITGATIMTAESKIMYQKTGLLIYVPQFNEKQFTVRNSNLMWDLAGKASLSCSSMTVGSYELEKKRKYSPKKKSGSQKLLDKIIGN
tara:strand:+ start:88 stop:501 length:414 start_codon:yes stop_codon:yes gene_type:complete